MYKRKNVSWKWISNLIFFAGLLLAILNMKYFLSVLFFALAVTIIVRVMETHHPKTLRLAIFSAIWLSTMALCFLIGQWFISVGGVIVGIVIASMVVTMMEKSFHWQRQPTTSSQTPAAYMPPQTNDQARSTEAAYQEGYKPQTSPYMPASEQESEEQISYANHYEQPQAQYPEL